MPSFAHQTTIDPPAEKTLQVAYIRQWCDSIAQSRIDKGTFANWCRRFRVSGRSEAHVSIEVAAGLLTCASLHWLGARSHSGQAYDRFYQMFKKEIEVMFNE